MTDAEGPSLRVQGEHQMFLYAVVTLRAIPARAGRTLYEGRRALCPMGHPCACREN